MFLPWANQFPHPKWGVKWAKEEEHWV